MNKAEMTAACDLAKTDEDLGGENISMLDGYGLPGFVPVHCTIRQVAALIRWQAMPIGRKRTDPVFMQPELDDLCNLARRRFIIVEGTDAN